LKGCDGLLGLAARGSPLSLPAAHRRLRDGHVLLRGWPHDSAHPSAAAPGDAAHRRHARDRWSGALTRPCYPAAALPIGDLGVPMAAGRRDRNRHGTHGDGRQQVGLGVLQLLLHVDRHLRPAVLFPRKRGGAGGSGCGRLPHGLGLARSLRDEHRGPRWSRSFWFPSSARQAWS